MYMQVPGTPHVHACALAGRQAGWLADLGAISIVNGHFSFLGGDKTPVPYSESGEARDGQDWLDHNFRPYLPTDTLELLQELHPIL